ncbi:Cadherin-13 [Camelus dromedarius]|uniref:Cadherin-13 n=1 Tax=Camelus dromedarius TaxID=9838 RepID=A0A5N4DRJ0_CAMDR|nr:Cadherin-13 [Camelus dromedarius]
MKVKLILAQISYEIDSFCNEISHMETMVLLLTSAEDLDCTPGFQQKVFHIDQPAEFIEDQAILNSIIPNGIYINMCGNVKPPSVWKLIELICKAGP